MIILFGFLDAGAQKRKASSGRQSDDSEAELSIVDDALRLRMEMAGAKVAKKKKKTDFIISEPFVLNTINPGKEKTPLRANDEKAGKAFKGQYQLPKPARVTAAIYQGETQIKRLFDEEQLAGNHPVFWNGLNEAGVKLFGDFECQIRYRIQNGPEKTNKIKFKALQ